MLMLQLSAKNSRIMQYFSDKADCEGKADQFLDCCVELVVENCQQGEREKSHPDEVGDQNIVSGGRSYYQWYILQFIRK